MRIHMDDVPSFGPVFFFFLFTAAWNQGGISATQRGRAHLRRYVGAQAQSGAIKNFTVPVFSSGRKKKCISDRFIRESLLAGVVSE